MWDWCCMKKWCSVPPVCFPKCFLAVWTHTHTSGRLRNEWCCTGKQSAARFMIRCSCNEMRMHARNAGSPRAWNWTWNHRRCLLTLSLLRFDRCFQKCGEIDRSRARSRHTDKTYILISIFSPPSAALSCFCFILFWGFHLSYMLQTCTSVRHFADNKPIFSDWNLQPHIYCVSACRPAYACERIPREDVVSYFKFSFSFSVLSHAHK